MLAAGGGYVVRMTSPRASEGQSNLDPQSETTSAPVPETSPPRRTLGPPVAIAVGLLLAFALLVALVVAAVKAA